MPNSLINETSPYLLQHANNPVNWFAWNEKTLAKAKEENKMLLISIGYAACHWCHVMEHESFENHQVAKVMNENGGESVASFVFPAILYPVNKNMKIYREEQFGPVIPVIPFEDLEEPIEYLIESTHGQQVSIFSNNTEEIASIIDPVVNQVSRVNINCQCQRGPDVFPFTGRKDSAEGTLSVVDALRSFSIRSLVATKLNDQNKQLINDIIHSHHSNFLSTRYIF